MKQVRAKQSTSLGLNIVIVFTLDPGTDTGIIPSNPTFWLVVQARDEFWSGHAGQEAISDCPGGYESREARNPQGWTFRLRYLEDALRGSLRVGSPPVKAVTGGYDCLASPQRRMRLSTGNFKFAGANSISEVSLLLEFTLHKGA